jgi:hypothetical protein
MNFVADAMYHDNEFVVMMIIKEMKGLMNWLIRELIS